MKHVLRIEHIDLRRSNTFRLHLGKLRISGGTILCVAGPNGSGKSTLVECLAGVLTSPTIRVVVDGQLLSHNVKKSKAHIGYIPDDEQWFIKELSASEYFALLTHIYEELGISRDTMQHRIQQLSRALLFSSFDQTLESLSHGNKKKVQCIAGLMHQPGIIILDELRNGLDPLAIIAAEEIIRNEAARGACVVAATHDLWWAERIADETMLLVQGSVAIHQRTSELLTSFGTLEKLFLRLVHNQEEKHAAV